ncbi:MAG TPA: hypothetical protein DCE41_17975 [Cytophagales bacterium]|nr:hypothetical protein [Cytophagales bacterium]HAA23638.1 hypothetical protein [Cytophagales bacterium]
MRFTKKQTTRGLLVFSALVPLLLWGSSSRKNQSINTSGEIGDPFPTLKAETLSRKTVVFPTDLRGKANILILVFKQDAQRLVNTWADIILDEYEPQVEITYHEVPMISTLYKPIGWQIDNWMRGGIPDQWHDNTATFYGDRGPYYEQLNMTEQRSCYVFVLDDKGTIRYRAEGPKSLEAEKEFREAVATLIN